MHILPISVSSPVYSAAYPILPLPLHTLSLVKVKDHSAKVI